MRTSVLAAAVWLFGAAHDKHLYLSRPFLAWLACLRARQEREALQPAALRDWRLRGFRRRMHYLVLAWCVLARAGRSRRSCCGRP